MMIGQHPFCVTWEDPAVRGGYDIELVYELGGERFTYHVGAEARAFKFPEDDWPRLDDADYCRKRSAFSMTIWATRVDGRTHLDGVAVNMHCAPAP